MAKKSLIGLILVLGLVVTAGAVYAHGPGWGGHMMGPGYQQGWGGHMMGPGYQQGWGGHMMGPGFHRGWGYGPQGQVDEETTKIFNELNQKYLEMNQLMSADQVDEGKVKALQAEINKLKNDLSEKRLAAELEFRKNNPDAKYGYGPRGGGPGYCWR